jgi:hypothetical protein
MRLGESRRLGPSLLAAIRLYHHNTAGGGGGEGGGRWVGEEGGI